MHKIGKFDIMNIAGASWCVCKQGQVETVLQKTLDYACGAGADCNPIHQNGICFNPNSVLAHCNYAVNSYFQRKSQAPGACDFAGAATVVTTDPSEPPPPPPPSTTFLICSFHYFFPTDYNLYY